MAGGAHQVEIFTEAGNKQGREKQWGEEKYSEQFFEGRGLAENKEFGKGGG